MRTSLHYILYKFKYGTLKIQRKERNELIRSKGRKKEERRRVRRKRIRIGGRGGSRRQLIREGGGGEIF